MSFHSLRSSALKTQLLLKALCLAAGKSYRLKINLEGKKNSSRRIDYEHLPCFAILQSPLSEKALMALFYFIFPFLRFHHGVCVEFSSDKQLMGCTREMVEIIVGKARSNAQIKSNKNERNVYFVQSLHWMLFVMTVQ